MTDSPLGKFFRSGPVQDFVKLPTIVKKSPGEWVPVGSSLSFDQAHHVRREMLLALASSYRPDLLLVDHMPHGAMGELLPALRELRRHGGDGPRIVLGLRGHRRRTGRREAGLAARRSPRRPSRRTTTE